MQMLIVSSGNKLAPFLSLSLSESALLVWASVGNQIKLMPNECTVSPKFSAVGVRCKEPWKAEEEM